MYGGFFRRGCRPVDADVVGDHVLLGVLAEPLVEVDQAAGALVADLAVVEVLVGVLPALGLQVRIGLGLLLRDPLVERLARSLFVRRVAEPLPGRPVFSRR